MTSRVVTTVSWTLMALVLTASLAIGATGERAPRTTAERIAQIASEVRCPTCRGLSVEESDAKAAKAVREEIAIRVGRGETKAQIQGYLASRYGKDILLRPEGRGVAGLVWSIPVGIAIVVLAALAATFRRWSVGRGVVTAEDRELVERELSRDAGA